MMWREPNPDTETLSNKVSARARGCTKENAFMEEKHNTYK
jgi:hypothetical protein